MGIYAINRINHNFFERMGLIIKIVCLLCLIGCTSSSSDNSSNTSEDDYWTDYDGPVCNSEGWAWQHPLPQGESLYGIWGPDENHIWYVGANGTILFYNGISWLLQYTLPYHHLKAIWGIDTRHMWAVGVGPKEGKGYIVFWDGETWSSQTNPSDKALLAVWGADERHVWAGGADGLFFYDGETWQRQEIQNYIYDIHGIDENNVWVIDNSGILFWNGETWKRQVDNDFYALTSVWAADANNVWAAGVFGIGDEKVKELRILFFDGKSWSVQLDESIEVGFDVHLTGYDSDHMWLYGGGVVYFREGETWSQLENKSLYSLWPTGKNQAWSTGYRGMYYWGGDHWQTISTDLSRDNLKSVFGVAEDCVWTVGGNTILFWNGEQWENQNPPSDAPSNYNSIWANSPESAWIAGYEGVISSWDGHVWRLQKRGTIWDAFYGVCGADNNHVWAVGTLDKSEEAIIAFWDGDIWTQQHTDTQGALYDIWVLDEAYAWTVGRDGRILVWNGVDWTSKETPTSNTLSGVWGVDKDHIWVVGDEGIFFWNGNIWERQTNESYGAIWGVDEEHVWAARYQNTVALFDGESWNSEEATPYSIFQDIWGIPSYGVWLVGFDGMILMKNFESGPCK